MADEDPRRRIPRTDSLLNLPALQGQAAGLSHRTVAGIVHGVQERARRGELSPDDVEPAVIAAVASHRPSSLRRVVNATGIAVHTNLGRAPLSDAAARAVVEASGYTNVEFDLATGARSGRGAGARAAALAACPGAEDVLVVNNGAGALVVATTGVAAGAEVVISRGEMVEIGAGFRLAELIESTGAVLREVGATNRTHPDDYRSAIGPATGCVVKAHASNFRISGFTASASIAELTPLCRRHGVPLIADLGSGLLTPDPVLPDEPDVAGSLADGADLVIVSGDKLMGGPQAGLIFGRADLIGRLARHPLARAVRADKMALAALEATLTGSTPPVTAAIHADPAALQSRTERLAREVGGDVVRHEGHVGGGGAPGVALPGWAVRLPEATAGRLRAGRPPVVPRVHDGACLLDLRCVPEADDETVLDAVRKALEEP